MKNWNKTGKIKSIVILTLSILPLILFDFNDNIGLQNNFYFGIIIVTFLSTVIFFPLVTKFWSLFGFKFEKPNWNESPISLRFSKSLNFFQFIAFWFITSGIINLLFFGVFYQRFVGESAQLLFGGIGLLMGIKLSLKWLGKSEKKSNHPNAICNK